MSWLSSALGGIGRALRGPFGTAASLLIPGAGPWIAGARLLSGRGSASDLLGAAGGIFGQGALRGVLGNRFMDFAGSDEGRALLASMSMGGQGQTPSYMQYSDGMMKRLQSFLNMTQEQLKELSPEWTAARLKAYEGSWRRNAELAGSLFRGSDPNPNQFDTNRDIDAAVTRNQLGRDMAEKELGVETTRLGLRGDISRNYLGGLMGGLEGGLRADQWAYPNQMRDLEYAYKAGSGGRATTGLPNAERTSGSATPWWQIPNRSTTPTFNGDLFRRYNEVPQMYGRRSNYRIGVNY